jgi:hypothetical protein
MATVETDCTGIVKSLNPVMKDGEHETWTNDKNVKFYKFWIEVGDVKSKKPILSKDETPWFKVGTAITFTKEILGEDTYNISKIGKPKSEDAKAEHIKDAYKDKPYVMKKDEPVTLHRMAMSKAVGLAVTFIKEIRKIKEYENYVPDNHGNVLAVADVFYDWITKGVENTDMVWTRRDMLLEAIFSIEWFAKWFPASDPEAVKLKLTQKVFIVAESYLTAPMAITADSLKKEEEGK